jgi:hypothetical protein
MDLHLDIGDGLGGVEVLGTRFDAVHNDVTAVELPGVVEVLQARGGGLITAVGDPAEGLQESRWAEVFGSVPPVAGAGCAAARAKNALIEAVKLGALRGALEPFLIRLLGGGVRLQPGLDGFIGSVEAGQIGNEILDDLHMRQRIYFHGRVGLSRDASETGKTVAAVDVHSARTANALAARAAESKGGILLILNFDERIKHHRPAFAEVDWEGLYARGGITVRIPSVDLEDFHIRSLCGRGGGGRNSERSSRIARRGS